MDQITITKQDSTRIHNAIREAKLNNTLKKEDADTKASVDASLKILKSIEQYWASSLLRASGKQLKRATEAALEVPCSGAL